MTTTMTSTAAFVEQTAADWDTWTALLDSIPDERKHEPGAVGFWSVKDTIAHITVYERWILEWLEPALEGNPPAWNEFAQDPHLSIDAENALHYEQDKDRTLADIQAESAQVHQRLMDLLHRLPEDAHVTPLSAISPQAGSLFDPGTTIPAALDGCAAGHYRHHIDDVRRWLSDDRM